MSIQTAYLPISYSGDGVANSFPIVFPYQFATDIVVSTKVVATGAVTPLVYGTDYTVSPTTNSPAATGTVTLTVVLPVGSDITIGRETPTTQLTHWTPNDPNPSTAIENSVDKLTDIVQELDYEVSLIQTGGSGGGGGSMAIVTTAVFAMAAVSASQNVAVNTTVGLAVGNNVQISNVINTLYGQITAINATTDTLTITTSAITAGLAGNTMPVGSPVQLASVPGISATTINTSDLAFSATPTTGLVFDEKKADVPTGGIGQTIPNVDLYIDSITAGVATIRGYSAFTSYDKIRYIWGGALTGTPLAVGFDKTTGNLKAYIPGGVGQFFGQTSSTALGFSFINAATSITPGTITPTLLNATNAPTNSYLASYDSGTGKFTWVAPAVVGAYTDPQARAAVINTTYLIDSTSIALNVVAGTSIMPTIIAGSVTNAMLAGSIGLNKLVAGTNSQFLRGDGAWSDTIVKSGGGLLRLSNIAGDTITNYRSQGLGGKIDFDSARGVNDFGQQLWVNGAIVSGVSPATVLIDPLCTYGSTPIEGASINGIIRSDGLRTRHGPWTYAYTINAPTVAQFIYLSNGSYQRLTGIANNVGINLSDDTPAPTLLPTPGITGWHYASELTLEINMPNPGFAVTFTTVVTWANGGSAPVMNAGGITIIRLITRQGLSGWIGYVESSAAGGGGYTDAQARSAVISGTYLLDSSSVTATIIAGTSVQYNIAAAGVTNNMLYGNISAQKLAGYPANAGLFLNGTGGWSTPAGGGGGGGQAPIQLNNNGVNLGTAGTYTTYNLAPVSSGPINMAVAGSFTTANFTSAYGEYNVKFYGALGNGFTNDAPAFNAALAAIVANGGGTLYIPAGNYKINSTLTITTSINIRGEGCAYRTLASSGPVTDVYTTRLTWGGSAGGTMLLLDRPAAGQPSAGGFTWEGFDTYGAGINIRIRNATGATFRNLSSHNHTICGIDLYGTNAGSAETTVNNCSFGLLYTNSAVTNAIGIRLDGDNASFDAFGNTFDNLFIVHNYIGLYLGNCDNNTFHYVQTYSNPATCPKIAGLSPDVYATNNVTAGAGAVCRQCTILHLLGSVVVRNAASVYVASFDAEDVSNGGTATTATFVIPAAAGSVVVSVALTPGILANGNYIYMNDGPHALSGHVSGIAGNNITIVVDVTANAGATMAIGAAFKGPFLPPVSVDSTSTLVLTSMDGGGQIPYGTWWYANNTTTYLVMDMNFSSPFYGAGAQTNRLVSNNALVVAAIR